MRVFVLTLLFVTNAFAWEISRRGEDMILTDKSSGISETVIGDGTEVSSKKISDDLTLVTYLESHAGTKTIVKVYNCALFSSKLKKVIFKDVLCKSVEGKKITEASVVLKDNKVITTYEDLTEEYTLK